MYAVLRCEEDADVDEYTCSAGETFDSIALELWGDELLAWHLMEENGNYASQQVFAGGETLYVPEISQAERTRAPWKDQNV